MFVVLSRVHFNAIVNSIPFNINEKQFVIVNFDCGFVYLNFLGFALHLKTIAVVWIIAAAFSSSNFYVLSPLWHFGICHHWFLSVFQKIMLDHLTWVLNFFNFESIKLISLPDHLDLL